MPKKLSFKEALLQEIANAPGAVKLPCQICSLDARGEFEEAYKSGISFMVLARSLQKIGVYSNIGLRTVSDKVAEHCRVHMAEGYVDG
jgi:hypothetical protein